VAPGGHSRQNPPTVPVLQRSDEIHDAISRCASAEANADHLRSELHELRRSPDPRAVLGALLFGLALARLGDAGERVHLGELADGLLTFWRADDTEQLVASHPALEEHWRRATELLQGFEQHRFGQALRECWVARQDPAALATAIEALRPEGSRRVEFARCLYHLELARLAVDSSRAQFARRAGLLAEAYQDAQVVQELVGGDEGLAYLWQELVPYLDEFFETLEEAAEARRRAADADADAQVAVEGAPPVEAPEVAATPRAALVEVKTDPAGPVPLGVQRDVPSFRTLIAQRAQAREAGEGPEDEGAAQALGAAPTPRPAPPPPGRDTLDEDGEVILVGEELSEALASSQEYDLVEGVEEVPQAPPPPPTGVGTVTPVPEEPPPEVRPDEATNAFWVHTFSSLELLPGETGRSARMLACERRAERKRLSEFVDSLAPHLQVPEARAMACLLSLMLAGQTKERNLFGQPNPRRADALAAALPYLSTDPRAAAHAAVWFELDGPQTTAALAKGLGLLTEYLAFCLREGHDPVDHAAVEAYLR
jgi:hypothetical protein